MGMGIAIFLVVLVVAVLLFRRNGKTKKKNTDEWLPNIGVPESEARQVLKDAISELKGEEGEKDIVRRIREQMDYGLYGYLLHNLYLPKPDGTTTEIDVVLLSVKGIFVIESKNYAGYIFGNSKQHSWTVTLYAGRNRVGSKQIEKHLFYNPIWQNQTHIKCLRKQIRSEVPIFSIIVFSGRGTIKNIEYDSEKAQILSGYDVSHYFANVRKNFPDLLSKDEVEGLYQQLLPYMAADQAKKASHVAKIQEQKKEPRCPRCGRKLVLRTAKKGNNAGQQFYGCTNYPQCCYTRNYSLQE